MILILLGWEFLAADIIGGFMLIGLMAFGFIYLVPDEVLDQARQNDLDEGNPTVQDPVCGMDVNPEETDYSTEHDGQTYYFCSQSCKESFDPEEVNTTIREQATSLSGWKALADKQWKEWGMLWDEIAIGFIFAGLIAGFIPKQVWTSVFSGPIFGVPVYIFWTAVVGAVIGVVTFVCSVGNVPFGTVLLDERSPIRERPELHLRGPYCPADHGRLSGVLRNEVCGHPLGNDFRRSSLYWICHSLPVPWCRSYPGPLDR